MTKTGKIHVGTSGWSYKSWLGPFYPQHTKSSELLKFYSSHFDSVELNNSFYKLPTASNIAKWRDQAPKKFLFSIKANRYLTHMKKLKGPEDALVHFFEAVNPFSEQLGPVIFQFPPGWRVNTERLDAFLQLLQQQSTAPKRKQYAFEFRNRSWLCQDIYQLLRKYNAAFCIYDISGYRSPLEVTADFVYLRLHGSSEHAYHGSYDGRHLAGLAKRFINWQREGKDVYCYFDNDVKACAPNDAQRLLRSLQRQNKR